MFILVMKVVFILVLKNVEEIHIFEMANLEVQVLIEKEM